LPAAGANIDSARQTTISWNSACLNTTSQIDIYLYAPLQPSSSLPIHAWTHVPASVGSYDVKLAPKWWNATSSVELSLNIVPSGNQPWDSNFSYGPTWFATYTAPTDGSKPPADAIVGGSSTTDSLISIFYNGGHLTEGGMAAAIMVPLIVLFIALAIWIRKMHLARNNKLADWSEHMDKRMSRISMDWTQGGDGSAGPVPGSRPASYINRPQSAYRPSTDAVRAAYAATVAQHGHGGSTQDAYENEYDEMTEANVNAESIHSATRKSNYRVSFAPSSVDNNARPRYSYAANRTSARPASKLNTSSRYEDDDNELVMSPMQEEGARPVQLDALRKSMDDSMRHSMLNYPALRMMDGEEASEQHEAYHEETVQDHDTIHSSPSEELNLSAIHESDRLSPHTGMALPASSNSPDEALKQYAALRAAAGPSPSPFAMDTSKMRTLYGAQPGSQHRAQQDSVATGSSINEDEVVGYNQMIDGQ
jgi:hypothetical protein